MGSEAPPSYCTPPTQIASPRGEVQRSLQPFQSASSHPPEAEVTVPAGGHFLQPTLSLSPHKWTLSPLDASLRGLGYFLFAVLGWNPGLAHVHCYHDGTMELHTASKVWVLPKAL